jgi:hypothetical protein
MTNRYVVIITTAACLLAVGHAVAQSPSPAPDYDKRLRALEDKMDRVLKAIEPREPGRPAAGPAAATIEAARDQIAAALEATEQQYRDFQNKNPFNALGGVKGATKVYAERLGKIESRRSELKIKMQEMTDQYHRIEKAYKEGGKAAAARMISAVGINGAEGLDGEAILDRLNRQRQRTVAKVGEKHSSVKDLDDAIALVKKVYAGKDGLDVEGCLSAMKEEIIDMTTRVNTLNNLFDAEGKQARELAVYEVADEKYRSEIDRLRQALNALDAILRGERQPAK